MSDPYAGRERVLTDEQRTTVAVWVNDIAARLGLRDWRVHVSPFAAFGDDALACSSLRDQASVSWIAVTRAWLESDDIERTTTLVHELLHCHFQPVTRLAERLIESELGRRTEAVIKEAISIAEETSIDRLASALSLVLPPFSFEPRAAVPSEPITAELLRGEVVVPLGGQR